MNLIKLIVKPVLALSLLGTASYGILKAPEWHGEYIRRKVGSQVVMLTDKSGERGGTGFQLQMPSGEVLTMTNAHVCELESLGQIYARQGRRIHPMTILEKSKKADLCLLNGIPKMTGLEVADSLTVGQEMGVVGHPALMPLAVSRGHLLGYKEVAILINEGVCKEEGEMYKTIEDDWGPLCVEQFNAGLTTVVVLGGNSGSPVVDFYGNVVGVLFAGHGPSGGNWGIIVPLSALKEFIKDY